MLHGELVDLNFINVHLQEKLLVEVTDMKFYHLIMVIMLMILVLMMIVYSISQALLLQYLEILKMHL